MDYVTCPFCNPKKTDIVLQCESWYSIWDKYPVSPGHLLLITYRHVPFFFDTMLKERQVLAAFIEDCKNFLDKKFHPDAYNLGVNIGTAAGQTVMHVHVHLIPRYKGDVKDPRGGVRGAIPDRRIYPEA